MKKNFLFIILVACALGVLSAQNSRQLKLELQEKAAKEKSVSASVEPPRIELAKNQICNVYALSYSPDGKHLVAGYNNNLVRIWDITTGEMLRELKGHTGVVWSVAYSPDGKMIISGSADKTVKCWNAETGELIRTLPSKKGDKGHSSIVSYVTFNPNGTYIASGSSDKSVKFWDSSTGMLLQTLDGTHGKTIAAIDYSTSGRYVATASWDKTTKIYHAMGGIERNLLTGHSEAVYAVQFSPDEKYIATGSADRTVRIYDVETGNFVRAITGITGEVWTLAYSPDGKTIATGNSDGSVILFDAATGKKLTPFSGHEKEVRSCAYDASGKHLFTGDSGGIIKMWDVEKGTLLVTMLQVTDGNWVTWTPDGFLTGSDGALEKLSYTVGKKKYSLEEIKSTVFRPDIVAAQMQGEDMSKIETGDSFADLIARENSPDIQFTVTNANGSKRSNNKERDVSVTMKITDTGSGIGKVYVKLNGRAFLASEGAATSVRGQSHSFSSATPLSLRHGKNTISVSVFDSKNKKEHQSASQEIEWSGNPQKSRLFVLAAGVDKYTDKAVEPLSGCVADAQALAETSRQYAGDLYINVFERVLVDKAVTHKNLLDSIREFGGGVAPDDVFILYLAGHGVTHTDGEYYYIPYDFKSSGKAAVSEYGVSKWEIVEALSSVKAENITVILDTCNSAGFATKQPSEKELLSMSKRAIIERMGALSGFDLLVACTSAQVAVDNFKGHGVFTYCLLDGIKGAADLDQNGQVTSAELATYVIKEVPIQANKKFGYKQEPQRSQPKFDFPMFGKLNPLEGQSLKDALEIAKLVREKGLDLEAASAKVTPSATESILVTESLSENKESEAQTKDEKKKDELASLNTVQDGDILFDGTNPIIIDAASLLGKATDEIRLYNSTNIPRFSVEVEGLDKKNRWKKLGTVKLKEIGERDEIDKNPSKWSQYRIKPLVSEKMLVRAFKNDDCLYIHFLFMDDLASNAGIIDVRKVTGGAFKDNVRLLCGVNLQNSVFHVFARKSESEPWVRLAPAFLKGYNDTDFIEPALGERVANYRFFAVQAADSEGYTYQAVVDDKDLYITVLPD